MTKCNISATVTAPAGLPTPGVILSYRPKTRAEFDAIAEAAGGPCAFSYYSETSTHADLGDGLTMILYAPEGEQPGHYARPLSESIRSLKEACKR